MRILVTGGAGFIGSAVVRQLIGVSDHTVLNLDKLTYAASLESLASVAGHPRYSFRACDICDPAALARAFDDFRPEAVMHLAAESHVDRSIEGPEAFVQTNVVGTLRLLDAARAYWLRLDTESRAAFRFHHVSTDEVFGALGPDDAPFREDTPYDPRSPYSASKAAADHLARAWGHTYGLPILVTNCTNNYGPFHFPEKLIPLTIVKALRGEALPVYGHGDNVRDWLYVDDHAAALIAVVERGRPGETYLIGGGAERKNLDVVTAVADLVDALAPPLASGKRRTGLIHFVADRPGHDFRYAMDAGKIERELGWRPSRRFEDGLEETVRWFLANESWWLPLFDRYAGGRLGAPPKRRRAGSRRMKVLLFGSTGQVARELAQAEWAADTQLVSLPRAAADFARPETLGALVRAERPGVVVIAAAYTAVERAESEEALAFAVNAEAPGAIAAAAAALQVPVIHLSTDYVFNGAKVGPYTESDATNPLNAYGRSKLAGEVRVREANPKHLILRTSWVYSAHGVNFVRSMLRLAQSRDAVEVVADQCGCPTFAGDLAEAIARLAPLTVAAAAAGTYHVAGATVTSWHGFAEAIFAGLEARGLKRPRNVAVPTSADRTSVRRPLNSQLSSERFRGDFGFSPRGFEAAVPEVLDAMLAPA